MGGGLLERAVFCEGVRSRSRVGLISVVGEPGGLRGVAGRRQSRVSDAVVVEECQGAFADEEVAASACEVGLFSGLTVV
ncbi:Uncharacterised protein [Mycobacteroides abscessus subsp. abscessus]|nr:Uncharacterised protein [Mycobacteroides abscessus subsp. abscessus]